MRAEGGGRRRRRREEGAGRKSKFGGPKGVLRNLAIQNTPQKSTLYAARLFGDIALMLYLRSRRVADSFEYIWADSSPQGGVEWLLARSSRVSKSKVKEVAWLRNELERVHHYIKGEMGPLLVLADDPRAAVDHDLLEEMSAMVRLRAEMKKRARRHVREPYISAYGVGGQTHET